MSGKRRRLVGAEVVGAGVHFRVWAPAHRSVSVVIGGRDSPLERETNGYFSGVVEDAQAGTRYKYRLGDEAFPDPASRFQPDGPHGESMVVDPNAYRWRDANWRGLSTKGLVLYELHAGTFTSEGTYAAAERHLPFLRDVGITAIELMPVNEFAGRFGWGYDGVDLFAPTRLYGTPDELRHFVDTAHTLGLGVILDVVYNHLGPDGCYLAQFAPQYFTKKYKTEWGEALNFDGDDAHGARTFFCENAAYWIDEFHLDGLRLDATQSIFDASDTHILRAIAESARAAAGDRTVVLIGENEPQDVALIRRYGLDGLWNDDWHHSANVAATGRAEAYYTDYRGRAQEFVSMAKLGCLYQGQRYRWQKKRRGTPSHDIEPERLIVYLQNHDQVANSARGERLHQVTSPGRFRALTALFLLQPQTPMLFQGQESGAREPFVYFADHKPELAKLVANGRREFLQQFPSIARLGEIPVPHDPATFAMCKLDHDARDEAIVRLHRDLLRLRRENPFTEQRSDILQGAVLSDDCLVLRWLDGDDRLLIVNLGRELALDPAPEPLLAPPPGRTHWTRLWSSEDPAYGGGGMAELESEENWRIPGECAVVLR